MNYYTGGAATEVNWPHLNATQLAGTAAGNSPADGAAGPLAGRNEDDVALHQRLFSVRATLTLSVRDAFNTRRQYTQLAANGLMVQTDYTQPLGSGKRWKQEPRPLPAALARSPR